MWTRSSRNLAAPGCPDGGQELDAPADPSLPGHERTRPTWRRSGGTSCEMKRQASRIRKQISIRRNCRLRFFYNAVSMASISRPSKAVSISLGESRVVCRFSPVLGRVHEALTTLDAFCRTEQFAAHRTRSSRGTRLVGAPARARGAARCRVARKRTLSPSEILDARNFVRARALAADRALGLGIFALEPRDEFGDRLQPP